MHTAPDESHDPDHPHEGQQLSIGLYIGSLVLIFGLLITLYGAFGGTQVDQSGQTFDKDVIWGIVMIAVALIVLALAWFSPRRRRQGNR